MKRWRPTLFENGKVIEECREVENPKIDAFLAEFEELCKKHGLDLIHEDGQGAFQVVDYSLGLGWWQSAHDLTGRSKL